MRSPSPFIFLFFVCLAFIGPTCHSEPKQTLLYEYDFNDGKIGPEWKNEGGDWAIDNGKVVSRDAQNKDLVLMKALPTDVAVEVEVHVEVEAKAKELENEHVTRMARTIEERLPNIISWYSHPISTGPLEGLNNKIKVLKRMAYGYRDMEFFSLKILFIHESKFQLSGA